MDHGQKRIRVGIVGFGLLGQYLYTELERDAAAKRRFEVAFVWNRSIDKVRSWRSSSGANDGEAALSVPSELVLENLNDFATMRPDLVVEVAHPGIYAEFGVKFLSHCSIFVGSPTAFADDSVLKQCLDVSTATSHSILCPVGALWGAQDIARMAQRGSLTALEITMKKPPQSMRLEEPLQSAVEEFIKSSDVERVLFRGPVGELCPLAPNNVNTMACAALASGIKLGFKGCVGVLLADKSIEAHVIEICVTGKPLPGRTDPFVCRTVRYNPCDPNAVTASATYGSFLSSLLRADGNYGPGLHFC
jgi:aspartate dehydrogenase